MRNTADVTGGKPIAVLLQSISSVSAINPSVDFYDIHGGKREVLFFYFVPNTTRETHVTIVKNTAKVLMNSFDHFLNIQLVNSTLTRDPELPGLQKLSRMDF
jgi:hypothetical protein